MAQVVGGHGAGVAAADYDDMMALADDLGHGIPLAWYGSGVW
ncbi:hypothetical protein [Mycobacterium simiae]|nr:hypothetical protein [Mycobacterium simiae]